MQRLVAIVAAALLAASCSGSKPGSHSPEHVLRALQAAHLQPHRVTLELTVEDGESASPPIDQLIAGSAVAEAGPQTTYDVEGGRAIVGVYRTEDEAAQYAALPRVVRVRNVVAMPVGSRISARLRAAVEGLG